ncbi:MAG: aminotransferase class IV [Henriciella sp.]
MTDARIVYLNGEYLPSDKAALSPMDRGFLFGQSAYEVTAVYARKMIDFDRHMVRLARTLEALDIPNPMTNHEWETAHQALIARNHLDEGLVYVQVSGGAYGVRDFAGPEQFTPTVFMFAAETRLIGDNARLGVAAITVEDTRWQRRDLKTTQLVSQTMAYRAARQAGAKTAIMIENGVVTEAASANVWIVDTDGRLQTRRLSQAILPGITRAALIDAINDKRTPLSDRPDPIECVEQTFDVAALLSAREVFTSSAGAMIVPIVSVDGVTIGDGLPGPVTRRLQAFYYDYVGADPDSLDWLSL